ncbi:hypothetical protein M406DRAFT_331153 [Cryphonectria parasitica EP155]|uniref:Uncharacterized protein n=1 Tax=Cryphonectria parasitica (strain ATCC 38755 / EP155) TaxID=660469 RepID=A0A9P4Y1G1_CRYP1|nr:uncharacterized protein M406DRAFT_331153 [Cryphonectria parasitica EP155]KAF3764836.1 hypothetical protein M406DRAFT_331153 [Cryphonectria parasitica EP155]
MCMFPSESSNDKSHSIKSGSEKSPNRNSWTKLFSSSKDSPSKGSSKSKDRRRPDSGGYFSVYQEMARSGHVNQRGISSRTDRATRAGPSQARDTSPARLAARDTQLRTNQSLKDASRLEKSRNTGKSVARQGSTDAIEAIRARALAKAQAQRASDFSPLPAPVLAEPPSDWRPDSRPFIPELVPAPLNVNKQQKQQGTTSTVPTSGQWSPGPSAPRPLPQPPRTVPQGPRPQPETRSRGRSSPSSGRHHQYGQMPHRQSILDRIEAAAAIHPDVLRRQQRQGSSRRTPSRNRTSYGMFYILILLSIIKGRPSIFKHRKALHLAKR